MDMKKGMICLSIIVILTLSIPNVAAASANKQTTNIRSSYAMDAPVKERPILVLMLSNNTTAVNTSVYFFGAIATGTKSQLNYIEGATINIQRMSYDGTTWYTEDTVTTMSGKYSGIFSVYITPKDPGTYIYRATYDGNNTYSPAVSNVVVLTAY
jgi:hypothetical protein